MGNGASIEPSEGDAAVPFSPPRVSSEQSPSSIPRTMEEALARGYTQEQIDVYITSLPGHKKGGISSDGAMPRSTAPDFPSEPEETFDASAEAATTPVEADPTNPESRSPSAQSDPSPTAPKVSAAGESAGTTLLSVIENSRSTGVPAADNAEAGQEHGAAYSQPPASKDGGPGKLEGDGAQAPLESGGLAIEASTPSEAICDVKGDGAKEGAVPGQWDDWDNKEPPEEPPEPGKQTPRRAEAEQGASKKKESEGTGGEWDDWDDEPGSQDAATIKGGKDGAAIGAEKGGEDGPSKGVRQDQVPGKQIPAAAAGGRGGEKTAKEGEAGKSNEDWDDWDNQEEPGPQVPASGQGGKRSAANPEGTTREGAGPPKGGDGEGDWDDWDAKEGPGPGGKAGGAVEKKLGSSGSEATGEKPNEALSASLGTSLSGSQKLALTGATWGDDDWDGEPAEPILVMETPEKKKKQQQQQQQQHGDTKAPPSGGWGSKKNILDGLSDEEDESDWDATPQQTPVKPKLAASSSQAGLVLAGSIEPDQEFAGKGAFGANKLAVGGSEDDGKLPALRCSSCGFDVLRFRGCAWAAEADYMHFRNFNGHSLELPKLTALLVKAEGNKGLRQPGGAAYACQCAWQSVRARKELSPWGTPPGDEGGAANGALRWQKAGVS